jgi:putative ABC transport system ATP-binding protein
MIRLENTSKRFVKNGATISALDDVTLDVPQGRLALVCGPSGSGKTTLINLIAGLARPSSGSVTVAGKRIDNLSPPARAALRAKRIAVVFQMFHLVPYLSALENVLLPTMAARCKDAPERARQLLMDLHLEHRMKHFPGELSAGERQRCALARALLNRPDVILADEPTGNLDEESAGHVLRALDQARADGATALLVSHQHLHIIEPDIEFRLRDGKLEG